MERDVLRAFWSGCRPGGEEVEDKTKTCVEVDVWIVESMEDRILELE